VFHYMMQLSKFWPLDFDQESEIYDNPSWNLPGRTKKRPRPGPPSRSRCVAKLAR
jgi:hypothetical protein